VDNIEAGARAIFRRAIREIGEDMPMNCATSALVHAARDLEAPVQMMVDRWQMIAMGRPDLEEPARGLMMRQAARAWYFWNMGPGEPRPGL
jgi:hypothetical protein